MPPRKDGGRRPSSRGATSGLDPQFLLGAGKILRRNSTSPVLSETERSAREMRDRSLAMMNRVFRSWSAARSLLLRAYPSDARSAAPPRPMPPRKDGGRRPSSRGSETERSAREMRDRSLAMMNRVFRSWSAARRRSRTREEPIRRMPDPPLLHARCRRGKTVDAVRHPAAQHLAGRATGGGDFLRQSLGDGPRPVRHRVPRFRERVLRPIRRSSTPDAAAERRWTPSVIPRRNIWPRPAVSVAPRDDGRRPPSFRGGIGRGGAADRASDG
jgi:hypothetical protein